MKTPEEVSAWREEESTPIQQEDEDSGAGGELNREGAPEDTKHRNKDETSPDHLWERVGPADGSGRSLAEDGLACHMPLHGLQIPSGE
ncbi:hypothetical protein NDU88_004934 [Pleurodeles waltl]|uniref:Uncharacterized protein n=1 Tax=Pleurodeles waltl TaxID=8319 RepID=A0AAV7NTW2_PLEWA|nr:hypothetical protein NDU88_004934 [Pleurodeles waltl]